MHLAHKSAGWWFRLVSSVSSGLSLRCSCLESDACGWARMASAESTAFYSTCALFSSGLAWTQAHGGDSTSEQDPAHWAFQTLVCITVLNTVSQSKLHGLAKHESSRTLQRAGESGHCSDPSTTPVWCTANWPPPWFSHQLPEWTMVYNHISNE